MITLSALFLGAVTALLVVLAPLLLRLYLDGRYLEPDRVAHLESIVDLTRWCLPQVFFYGMYVLVGQVLNARGRFGPMMWAPIANNVIAVAMLVAYLARLGAGRRRAASVRGRSTPARRCCSASARRSASSPSAWCWCPTCAPPGSPTARASTSATPSSSKTLSLGIWTVLFVDRHPDGVPRGGQARLRRRGGGRRRHRATPSTPTAC